MESHNKKYIGDWTEDAPSKQSDLHFPKAYGHFIATLEQKAPTLKKARVSEMTLLSSLESFERMRHKEEEGNGKPAVDREDIDAFVRKINSFANGVECELVNPGNPFTCVFRASWKQYPRSIDKTHVEFCDMMVEVKILDLFKALGKKVAGSEANYTQPPEPQPHAKTQRTRTKRGSAKS